MLLSISSIFHPNFSFFNLENVMTGMQIEEIPNDLIKLDVRKVVEKLLDTKSVKIWIEPGSKKGDNFIGIVYRILYGRANEEKDENSSFILKIAPQNLTRRKKFGLREFFTREIFMYSEVTFAGFVTFTHLLLMLCS